LLQSSQFGYNTKHTKLIGLHYDKVVARVQSVQRQAAANLQSNASELGCESACTGVCWCHHLVSL